MLFEVHLEISEGRKDNRDHRNETVQGKKKNFQLFAILFDKNASSSTGAFFSQKVGCHGCPTEMKQFKEKRKTSIRLLSCLIKMHRHRQVPSTLSRLAVMDAQSSICRAFLVASA